MTIKFLEFKKRSFKKVKITIRKIKRTSASTFEVSAYTFEEDTTVSAGGINKTTAPFFKYSDGTTTLTPSGTTGSITLTASTDTFVSAHNGTYIQLGETPKQ